jgi:trehalose 6-phosphate phosphatase
MTAPTDAHRALAPFAAAPERVALLFDVDGTLSPIVEHAQDAALLPGMAELLRRAAVRFGMVAFITGRSAVDLDRIVGLPELPAATNHGMELRRGGRLETTPEAAAHRDRVADFARRWASSARLEEAGIWLEDKGTTLSFHYRTAPDRALAERVLGEEVAAEAEAAGLAAGWGRRILEVRPPVELNKGTAVRELLEGTGLRCAVYVGDDLTDLDAWAELRRMVEDGALDDALCVAAASQEAAPEVGDSADITVDGPPGVREALRTLLAAHA